MENGLQNNLWLNHDGSLQVQETSLGSAWRYQKIHGTGFVGICHAFYYESRLQILWTHLITPSRNFVEVLWRSLFEVIPLASDAILTTLNPLLENVLKIVDHFEISCLGAPFSRLEKPRNRMGRDLDCMGDVLMGCHHPIFQTENRIQFRSRPMQFLGFSNHENWAPWQEISKWSTVCSTISRREWSAVRSASLAKGGT
jgi:hypothetical protein